VKNFTIRRASLEDAEAAAAVQCRSSLVAYRDIFPPEAPKPTPEGLTPMWRSRLEDDRWAAWVAEAAGDIVGAVMAGPDPDAQEKDRVGHLARMYVVADCWGRGVGRALYGAAIEWLRSAGFLCATLWVLEKNTRGRRLYEHLGWVEDGRELVWDKLGVREVGYRLELGPSHGAGMSRHPVARAR
jgi:GNAT superfamily N-acetyltransferase